MMQSAFSFLSIPRNSAPGNQAVKPVVKSAAVKIAVAVSCFSAALVATPAFAHHALGGKLPTNFLEGFLSGLAHPIIGLDHFAFVVAVGLLAATKPRGIWMPIAFVLMAMLGTGMHLMSASLPIVELFVSGSILLFGVLLTLRNTPSLAVITGLSGIAGLFHGYAYGEAIFGAEMTPLLSYLVGFTAIQLLISLAAFRVGKALIKSSTQLQLRSAGLVICGIGVAFLATQIVDSLFPAG